MYNLLVSAASDTAWTEKSFVFDRTRIFEDTAEELRERFSPLDAASIATLKQLPTLFAYEELSEEPAHVGTIRSIDVRGNEVSITFDFDTQIPPIEQDRMNMLAKDLRIGAYEMHRTHWAVKEADLMQALGTNSPLGSSLIAPAKATYRFSRATLINACEFLAGIGHTGFDRFLLELGIAAINAGRDRGSLLARSNALAEFVVANQDMLTAEGDLLGLSVVRKAADIDPHFPDGAVYGLSDQSRGNFWRTLARDGFERRGGNIVPMISDGAKSTPTQVAPTANTPQLSEKWPIMTAPVTNKVFLVHGRDDGAKHEVARYMEKLGLDVVILHEKPNGGRTLISKFREESADVSFAIVLMTADDEGRLKAEGDLKSRARQNVVFELGFFIGKLGPDRVCALVAPGLDKPSDFEAVVYIAYGAATQWQVDLARELRHAGVPFDLSNVL